MNSPYADIIHLPHHVSQNHPQMPMLDRAAPFAPFAALTGYDDSIAEAGRLTTERRELSGDSKTRCVLPNRLGVRSPQGRQSRLQRRFTKFFSTFFDLPLGIHVAICYNI